MAWFQVISHIFKFLMACFHFDGDEEHKSSSSINDLPLEILLEILYKLSVEELHRNKMVSKLWSSLISHPSFRSEYSVRGRSSSPPAIRPPPHTWYYTYYHYNSNFYSVECLKMFRKGEKSITMSWSKDEGEFLPRIPGRNSGANVLASSNGLLLCCTKCLPSPVFYYYVFNPFTMQWLILPSPPTDHCGFDWWGIVCCDGSTRSQFKVVKIASRDSSVINSNVVKMEIFESVTNRWRKLTTKILDPTTTLLNATAIVPRIDKINAIEHKGILYWLKEHDFVLAFDPNLDLVRQISLPGSLVSHSLLGLSQDHLYYVQIDFSLTPTIVLTCTVWRCDEFEGEYTWSVHGRFDSEWIYPQVDGLRFEVFAIDPMDCNVLYFSVFKPVLHWCCYYSLDVERRQMRELCSLSKHSPDYCAIKSLVMLVQPTWPTSVR